MKRIIKLLSLLLVIHLAAAQDTYTNPVVTPVAADPSVIRTEDGTFDLYVGT